MNQLFEIIDINNSTIIVIGKTYCGIDYYISELEIELDRRQFRGEIIFDLLLANGLYNQNRIIISRFRLLRLYEHIFQTMLILSFPRNPFGKHRGK